MLTNKHMITKHQSPILYLKDFTFISILSLSTSADTYFNIGPLCRHTCVSFSMMSILLDILSFDQIIAYQIPRSPSFLEIQLAPRIKITPTTDWNNPTAVVNEN